MTTAQDSGENKYTVQVPGGLAFSEFRGYEAWQTISLSRNDKVVGVIPGEQRQVRVQFLTIQPRSQGNANVGRCTYRCRLIVSVSPAPGARRTVKYGASTGTVRSPTTTLVA